MRQVHPTYSIPDSVDIYLDKDFERHILKLKKELLKSYIDIYNANEQIKIWYSSVKDCLLAHMSNDYIITENILLYGGIDDEFKDMLHDIVIEVD